MFAQFLHHNQNNMEDLQKLAENFGWELDYLTDGSPIFQCKKYYTFTSDSVELAKFVEEENIGTLVDFCSGSGIVGLEIIGRIKTQKLAQFEIQPELANLCTYTNKYNTTKTKIELYNESLTFAPNYLSGVDVVCCNPPYFKRGSGKINESDSKSLARHELSVTLEEIICTAEKILKNGGSLYFIHIVERLDELRKLARKYNFTISKEKFLEGNKLKRFLIKLVKI